MKRRKGLGFDDDFFQEFEKIEELMRKMLDSHFEDFEDDDLRSAQPRVYGFSLSFGPEGKGELKELSAMPKRQEREPKQNDRFVEVLNLPQEVTLVVELPGVEPKHIHLKAFSKQLSIRVTDPDRLFSKTIALPAEVEPDSLKKTLKNGILEVVLKKK